MGKVVRLGDMKATPMACSCPSCSRDLANIRNYDCDNSNNNDIKNIYDRKSKKVTINTNYRCYFLVNEN